jgi:hypothetical protein
MRALADLDTVDATGSGSAFAEKLSHWVSFTDAIALSAVHQSATANAPIAPGKSTLTNSPVPEELNQALAKVRASVLESITDNSAATGSRAHSRLPEPQTELPAVPASAYEPYRRYYAAHQRTMETCLGPLRATVRTVLTRTSAGLKQLADLDAALDAILSERESKLLAKIPSLMQRRYMHLRPLEFPQNKAWQVRFGKELQSVLMAELDLRLQPTVGLIEAYTNEMKTTT